MAVHSEDLFFSQEPKKSKSLLAVIAFVFSDHLCSTTRKCVTTNRHDCIACKYAVLFLNHNFCVLLCIFVNIDCCQIHIFRSDRHFSTFATVVRVFIFLLLTDFQIHLFYSEIFLRNIYGKKLERSNTHWSQYCYGTRYKISP
jgi:hypothetical protein